MAFTYDINTNRGKVRRLCSDTDSGDQIFTDDEIDFFLDEASDNIYGAASAACDAIAAEFSRKADTSIESVKIQYSQRAEQFSKRAIQLAQKAVTVGNLPTPSVLGASKGVIRDKRGEQDRVREKFYSGRFSNPQDRGDDKGYNYWPY